MKYQHIGQIYGTFKAGDELMDKIKTQENNKNIVYIIWIGIQCQEGKFFYLNEEQFQMGKTRIFEVQDKDAQINSIKFLEDTKATIDFVYSI